VSADFRRKSSEPNGRTPVQAETTIPSDAAIAAAIGGGRCGSALARRVAAAAAARAGSLTVIFFALALVQLCALRPASRRDPKKSHLARAKRPVWRPALTTYIIMMIMKLLIVVGRRGGCVVVVDDRDR